MGSGAGHYDSGGNPCIKFHLCGVAHKEPGLEFEGVIDTGFTGFIQLPIHHAFSLKLPLEGTASYTLADGSPLVCLTALAVTTFQGKKETGAVTLAFGSNDILIGLGFLRQFKLGMILFKNFVFMVDEEEVQKFQEEQEKLQKQAKPASPPPPEDKPKS